MDIGVRGNPRILPRAVEQAFEAINRVHRLMSFHEPESDVSRLNRNAFRQPTSIDRQTRTVLERALSISEKSEGAFDITVAPQLVKWGYLPGGQRPLPTSGVNGYRSIQLLPDNHVRFGAPMLIDLGGIAKGYAVDAACTALETFGVHDYVVNAGGDLRVGSSAARIHVRNPRQPSAIVDFGIVRSAAIATSAAYFTRKSYRFRDVHTIVNATAAAPARYQGSISVRAASCMTADALTKVVAVLQSKAVPALKYFDAEAFLLSNSCRWRKLPTAAQGNCSFADISPGSNTVLQ